jgi:hypothetical protein
VGKVRGFFTSPPNKYIIDNKVTRNIQSFAFGFANSSWWRAGVLAMALLAHFAGF